MSNKTPEQSEPDQKSDSALEADNPDVAAAAHRLRRMIANWRDRLKGRQDGDFDESRQRLIDQLGEDYRRVNEIALRSEG